MRKMTVLIIISAIGLWEAGKAVTTNGIVPQWWTNLSSFWQWAIGIVVIGGLVWGQLKTLVNYWCIKKNAQIKKTIHELRSDGGLTISETLFLIWSGPSIGAIALCKGVARLCQWRVLK